LSHSSATLIAPVNRHWTAREAKPQLGEYSHGCRRRFRRAWIILRFQAAQILGMFILLLVAVTLVGCERIVWQ
jgi:hypothetical protein